MSYTRFKPLQPELETQQDSGEFPRIPDKGTLRYCPCSTRLCISQTRAEDGMLTVLSRKGRIKTCLDA